MFNVIAYRDLIAFKIKRSLLGLFTRALYQKRSLPEALFTRSALYQKRSLLKVLCAKTVYKRFL
jgi:hypothetical protein